MSWKKNVFVILYGKIGRDFVDQLTIHINQWSSDSVLKHIAPFPYCTVSCRITKARDYESKGA
jgi:hypothetical protein